MKLYEYMAKDVFREYGIPTPAGKVARTPAEAKAAAEDLGPVALKSQVLTGGRGKAGGIKFAETPEEAHRVAEELLGSQIKGYDVETLLVEEMLDIRNELYLGITIDSSSKQPVLISSAEGGVEIEDVPDKDIVKLHVDVENGVFPYVARTLVHRLGLKDSAAKQVASIAGKLYQIFKDKDAELVEINPLVISESGVIAADGRLNIDSEAMYRHDELPTTSEATDLEKRVRDIGLAYVELDGDIAVMANGAGITMATIDILRHYGGRAMNFLDAGGGAASGPMAEALGVLVSTDPSAILVNIFGGITRCDDVAKAILHVKDNQGIPVPLVVRLVGTNEEEGVKLLKDAGIEAFSDLSPAAEKVVALAKEGA